MRHGVAPRPCYKAGARRALLLVAPLAGILGCSSGAASDLPGISSGGSAGLAGGGGANPASGGAADRGSSSGAGLLAGAGGLGSTSRDPAGGGGAGGQGGTGLGQSGASAAGAASYFGASRCAPGMLLCEDFESESLNTDTWSVEDSTDPPKIDATRAARGKRALHIVLPEAAHHTAFISEHRTFPVPNDTYYTRIFVYFAKIPMDAPAGELNWAIAAAKGKAAPGEASFGARYFKDSAATLFKIGNDQSHDTTGSGTWYSVDADPTGSPRSIPLDTWSCVEWMYAGGTSETRFWWDEREHESMHSTALKNPGNGQPYQMPEFESVWLGFKQYMSSAGSLEMWIDEVAIDSTRIGCVR